MRHPEHRQIVTDLVTKFNGIKDNIVNNIILTLSSTPVYIITSIPPTGLILILPGTYRLANNIDWYPDPDAIAITIIGSDINLDLNCKSIINHNYVYNTLGILIVISNNISIYNGSLVNPGSSGIIIILSNNITINHIAICRLSNNNLSLPSFAILAAESTNLTITNNIISNIDVIVNALSAIAFISCQYINILNNNINGLLNRAGVCSGISFIDSSYANTCQLNISDLSTGIIPNVNAPGHTAIGLVPTQSNNLYFSNCIGCNISGGCDDAHFVSLYWVTNCTVESCRCSNIIDGTSGKGAKATGFEIYGIRDVSNANIIIRNCLAENIKATNPGDKQAAGFSVAGSGVTITNCIAKNIKVYGNGCGVGFGWAPDIREINIYPANNVTYDNCAAKDCQVGFDTFNHTNSKWICPKTIHCGEDFAPYVMEKIYYCDKCSECPQGITYVRVVNMARNNRC